MPNQEPDSRGSSLSRPPKPNKNTCVFGSPTDPKNSVQTLNFFSKKNLIFRITNLLGK